MNEKVIAQFEIKYHQVLSEQGKLVDAVPDFAHNPEVLITLYRHMCLTRAFDQKAIALQRTGKLGTYPSTLGQEALGTAIGYAMQSQDVLCPYYRENAAHFWRGVALEELLLFWGGSELGSDFSNATQDLPICVPIASQTLHAVGIAKAIQYRKEKRAVVVCIGEGGTSRGDFYEAMNAAGVWKLPVVFIINNNKWAISVPCEKQTAAQSFAQKAFAAGLPCKQIDGNDILVVTDTISAALQRAYQGEGATVIEALSYRMCDHTTADDASRYRNQSEVDAAAALDPILRVKQYLENNQQWDDAKEELLQQEISTQVQQAVEQYINTPKQPPASIFDYLYETLPEALIEQKEELIRYAERGQSSQGDA